MATVDNRAASPTPRQRWAPLWARIFAWVITVADVGLILLALVTVAIDLSDRSDPFDGLITGVGLLFGAIFVLLLLPWGWFLWRPSKIAFGVACATLVVVAFPLWSGGSIIAS